jgi:hypothetical protein
MLLILGFYNSMCVSRRNENQDSYQGRQARKADNLTAIC